MLKTKIEGDIIEIIINKEVIARVKVTTPPYIDYQLEVFPVALPNRLQLEVKGHGYRLKRKEMEGNIKCDCGNSFFGVQGKEDTCTSCLKDILLK